MKIVGIGHYSRVGKTSFANFLQTECEALGLTVLQQSLAWKLKEITHSLYSWAGLREPAYYETDEGAQQRRVILPALGKTPVQIWVDTGTKAFRDQVYDRTWIDYLRKSNLTVNGKTPDVLIVPDVRFINEATDFKADGATLVKIVRPGYGPLPTKADMALIGYTGWDYVFGGTGSMGELAARAKNTAIVCNGGTFEQAESERNAALSVEVLPKTSLLAKIKLWYQT